MASTELMASSKQAEQPPQKVYPQGWTWQPVSACLRTSGRQRCVAVSHSPECSGDSRMRPPRASAVRSRGPGMDVSPKTMRLEWLARAAFVFEQSGLSQVPSLGRTVVSSASLLRFEWLLKLWNAGDGRCVRRLQCKLFAQKGDPVAPGCGVQRVGRVIKFKALGFAD
jgi:hypothetical protein